MSQGTAIAFAKGKHHKDQLYIKLMNGSIYRHPDSMDHRRMENVINRIKRRSNKVQLKYWIHVRRSDGTLVQLD